MPTDTDIEREFADLVELLREDKMEVAPFFARELDQKVAAGFPREPRWRTFLRFHPMLIPGTAASMLAALVVTAAIMAPGGGGDDEAMSGAASGGGGNEVAQSAPPETADEADELEENRSGSISPAVAAPRTKSGSPSSDRRAQRQVETSAALVLGAKPGGVQRVADEVVTVTDRHRGFVISSSVDLVDGGGGAAFELRVPSDRLKPALADLSRIGDVRERREASQDITQEFVSARSRLADARAERTGLLRQLERATTDLERERVKALLRRVSSRISAAKTDLARVNNRASFSTIAVTVVGDPAAGTGEGSWTPGDAAKDALRVLEVAAGVLLIALAVGLPLALIAGLALLLARLTQRRRRERLLDAV
jgi:hypothetical protein